MLRMDEGIWEIWEIQSCLFDQNFTHIFGYKKKIIQKKILRPSGGHLYINQVRKISNWSVKPFWSYSDRRLRKHGVEKNAFKVLSTICMQVVERTAAPTYFYGLETAPIKVIYLQK